MKTIGIFLSLLLALGALQGCSKGSSSTASSSTVRLVNVSTNYPSLDMLSSTTTLVAGVGPSTANGPGSAYAGIASGFNYLTLNQTGGSGVGTYSVSLTASPNVNPYFTLLAYTSGQSTFSVALLPDGEAAPQAGYGTIRVYNLAIDAGNTGKVDVYVMATGSAAPTSANLAQMTGVVGASLYVPFTPASYSVWVTGAGNPSDVRLYIPSVALANQQILTLALTSATGGYLLNGVLMTQQATSAQPVQRIANTFARVRVVANIDSGGTVMTTPTVSGVASASSTLVSGSANSVGAYNLVSAGALSMSPVVNGTPYSPTLTAAAGADVTLLVTGNGVTPPQFIALSDDNSLPPGNQFKIRLINSVNGYVGAGLTLGDAINGPYLNQTNIAFGTAATPLTQSIGTSAVQPQVTGFSGGLTLNVPSGAVTFQSQGVYSVFALGNNASPFGVFRRDR